MCECSHLRRPSVKHKNHSAEGEFQAAPAGTDYLSDYSPRDKPWDTHRANSDIIAELYVQGGEEFERYAKRVHFCSGFLEFAEQIDQETGEVRPKLRRASFCRVRTCTICQWRRTLVNKAKFLKKLPAIMAEHRKARLIFLTLTVRNCNITDLKATVKAMNAALRRMVKRQTWPALGWVKSIEVTHSKDVTGNAHPHFHLVLLVPPGYFGGRSYIKQVEWAEAWQQALKADYQPRVDIRAIKAGQEAEIAPELLKYSTKPADLVVDPGWFHEYSRQVKGMRFLESGGCFRDVFKDDPDEDEMLHVNEDGEEEPAEEDSPGVWFKWDRPIKRYKKHKLKGE